MLIDHSLNERKTLLKQKDMNNWFIKKIKAKARKWYRGQIKGTAEYTETEQAIRKMVHKLACNPANTIRVAPMTKRIYLVTPDHQYQIQLDDVMISITNHQFFFHGYLRGDFADGLRNLVYHYQDKWCKDLETDMHTNENNGWNAMMAGITGTGINIATTAIPTA